MNRLPDDPALMQDVIGVIDLLGGNAVHAIAGNRDQYQSVAFCGGSAIELASHYRSLGTHGLYVADLSAITTGKLQTGVLRDLCESSADVDVLIDVGWTGTESDKTIAAIRELAGAHANTYWIAATESAKTSQSIASLGDLVGSQRMILGLDFRDGNLITTDNTCEYTTEHWLDEAQAVGCTKTLVLDLAGVGTSEGPKTLATCKAIRKSHPEFLIYSGGGIRTGADVQALADAGCERCLVATALHP